MKSNFLFTEKAKKEFDDRKKNNIVREPLITFTEVCAKYKINKAKMFSLFKLHPNHPKKVMTIGSKKNKNTWYRAKEFDNWFNKIKDEL